LKRQLQLLGSRADAQSAAFGLPGYRLARGLGSPILRWVVCWIMATGALTVPLASHAAAPAPLTVFAAASTRDALQELALRWQQQTGVGPRLVFAGTASLARQIEQGAPAQLFISADQEWTDYLLQRRLLVQSSVEPLLGNRLVLIAPRDAKFDIVELKQGVDLKALLGTGRLALADVRSVPAGRYAKAALQAIGAWEGLQDRFAMSENVRVALAFVARGEAPLGIVYESDARAEPRVRVMARFDEKLHPAIVYPLAVVTSGPHPQTDQFKRFLQSDEAAEVFRRYGFKAPVIRSGAP
jgi:molybdate transport system substrate-binding protein